MRTREGSSPDNDRDGAVVDELELHPRAEAATLHGAHTLRREAVADPLVERLCQLGGSGLTEARAVALRSVAVERELADDERRATRVEQARVEAAGGVGEDAQARQAGGQPVGLGLTVPAPDPEEDCETRADRADHCALDAHLGARHALDDSPHVRTVDCEPCTPTRPARPSRSPRDATPTRWSSRRCAAGRQRRRFRETPRAPPPRTASWASSRRGRSAGRELRSPRPWTSSRSSVAATPP